MSSLLLSIDVQNKPMRSLLQMNVDISFVKGFFTALTSEYNNLLLLYLGHAYLFTDQ